MTSIPAVVSQLGAKGVPRLAYRASEDLLDGLHMVAALLRGTPLFYYGDELGVQGDVRFGPLSPFV